MPEKKKKEEKHITWFEMLRVITPILGAISSFFIVQVYSQIQDTSKQLGDLQGDVKAIKVRLDMAATDEPFKIAYTTDTCHLEKSTWYIK